MRKFVVALIICLIPAVAWSAEKITSGTAQKEAEEDICYTYLEYREAEGIFRQETGGSYRPGTRGGHLARASEMKQRRLNTLIERYHNHYGKWFNPQTNPQSYLSK